MHLPFSERNNDEFQGPDGQWYSIYRAISYDNWLIWRQALPETPLLRGQLTPAIWQAITSLGSRWHRWHQQLPDYRRLADNPLVVSRWWDPTAEAPWHQGRRMLLRCSGYTSAELLTYQPRRSGLLVEPISRHWLELELASGPGSPAPPSPP